MNEWAIAFATLAVIFFLLLIALIKSWASMYDRIQELEKRNADLHYSIRAYKDEIQVLRNRIPDTDQITRLQFQLHMKQERIDALNAKLKEQRVLLQQKWEGSKKCV